MKKIKQMLLLQPDPLRRDRNGDSLDLRHQKKTAKAEARSLTAASWVIDHAAALVAGLSFLFGYWWMVYNKKNTVDPTLNRHLSGGPAFWYPGRGDAGCLRLSGGSWLELGQESGSGGRLVPVGGGGKRDIAHAPGPGRLQAGDLPVDRASGVVGAGQVAGADRELAHDLAGGEDEVPLQDLNAMPTRKAACFQRKSSSNRQGEIISNNGLRYRRGGRARRADIIALNLANCAETFWATAPSGARRGGPPPDA